MTFWHQKVFLQPTVRHIWEKEQEVIINHLTVKKESLILGGDGRADSPDHSAKYGSYFSYRYKTEQGCGYKIGSGISILMLLYRATTIT